MKEKKIREKTRKLNPKFGYFGILGLLGFLGFWTYSIDKTVFPFIFFLFFGFFGFFFEGKMSDTFMDERFHGNRKKAELKAYRVGISLLFFALVASSWGWL